MWKPNELTHAQWNSGWPQGDFDIDFDQDQSYISKLGSRTYMAAASPWFFTVSLLPPRRTSG